MRVIDYFDRGVLLGPDVDCLIAGDVRKTYRQVQRRSHQIANALIADGFAPLDHASVLSGNSLEAFECILGTLRADGVWVIANNRAAIPENVYLLDLLDTAVLFFHSEVEDRIDAIRNGCPKIRRYICIDRTSSKADAYLEDWIKGHDGPAPERLLGDPDDLCILCNTGGTTGRPKGVMWSNRTWATLVANYHAGNPTKKPHIHLVAAPMTHAAGPISLILMAIGSTNIVLPGFKPEAVMAAVEKYKVTFFFLPPTAIYMLMAHPDVRKCDWSSVEQFTYAAAPMSVSKLREAREIFGPIMASGFGQVEAPATCTIFPAWEHRDGPDGNLGSCGRPAIFTKLAIMDDDGNLLPDGERGEIVVRGDLVMIGYYKNPEATAEVSRFGWHHTGDVGYRDSDGYYYIIDRKKDMIITGGFNVYSAEVEQVVLSHPAVQDCAVVGAPDDKWGEAVTAVCELKPGAKASEDEIIALCKERLGSVKTPKAVHFETSLPRSAAGKVLKKAIRDKLWEGQARRI